MKSYEQKGLVPLVSREVFNEIKIEAETDKSWTTGMLNKLLEENPLVAGYIANMSVGSANPIYTTFVAVGLYRLIEKQIESDIQLEYLLKNADYRPC